MADRNWQVAILAVLAGAALAGCLPEARSTPPTAPAQAQNTPPVISGTPGVNATAGTTWQFQPTATDAQNDALTFSATGLPGWASINPQTGRISGMPTESDVGTSAAIVVSVSDGRAMASLPAFSIVVASAVPPPPPPPVNTRPTISGTPATSVQAGTPYSFTPSATDAETPQGLTFSILNRPSWASFSSVTGTLSGTPSANQAGTYANIVISVSDGALVAALPTFSLTVTAAANRPPVISGTPATSVVVGQAYRFAPTATDPDGDSLTWAISGKPGPAVFNVATGELTWSPGSTGTWSNIIITVTDSRGASASLPSFSITVTSPPATGSATISWTAPMEYTDGSTLPGTDLTGFRIYHGTSASSLVRVGEVDGNTLTYTVEDLVPGTHYFAVSAVTNGTESARSAIGSKLVP